jgi:hypothetical protein
MARSLIFNLPISGGCILLYYVPPLSLYPVSNIYIPAAASSLVASIISLPPDAFFFGPVSIVDAAVVWLSKNPLDEVELGKPPLFEVNITD